MQAKDLLPPTTEFDEPDDPQLDAIAELEELAHLLDLETWIVNTLRHCERELSVNLPLVRDDGIPASITAHRVQHLTWRGPSLGPVMMSPVAHLNDVRARAMNASWQHALLGLPFGGAAGAIVCDPGAFSERELRQIAKDFSHATRGMLGRHSDVISPGAGCNEQIMAWLLDGHAQSMGRLDRGAVTGVPVALMGLPCPAPIARGINTILNRVIADIQGKTSEPAHSLVGQRICVLGFGSLGQSIAQVLYDFGARVVGISDVSGSVYSSSGINVPALIQHSARDGVVYGFAGADPVTNADLLEAECEVLIVTAGERQLTSTSAQAVNARIIVEASRASITRGAEDSFAARGSIIVPEVLATAGAVVAAFLEWTQAERISFYSAEEVEREIDIRVVQACDKVLQTASARKLSTRRAAGLIALERIATEMRLRK